MAKKIGILLAAFFGLVSLVFLSWKVSGADIFEEVAETTETANDPIVVIELFTSQGCSSCPPADDLLQKVKEKYPNTVFALSYHVDYWNYIGWTDPFSKSQYTTKQGFYNRKFNYRSNYTPEAVVNGREHFVGSNRTKMTSKIAEYAKKSAENRINLSNAKRNDDSISFEYHIEGETSGKLIRAVLVLDERITSVKRGENRNRTLTNSNIVVHEKYLEAPQKFGEVTITIPPLVKQGEALTLMLFVENDTLDITGAAKTNI